eukprot:CAMPEP_0180786304 /NCGR_PEP_ID=MMETSP1038_2-20121128/50722_1 /TAXON_ID=632150 /ORGANISM="Azadinium spinosum, Strain 3D9" /LENGTH=65 /DNA_ID=CAMNT_0022823403 /DNA_START=698 /DNA_END=896 /DNA_ORIENTATION=+
MTANIGRSDGGDSSGASGALEKLVETLPDLRFQEQGRMARALLSHHQLQIATSVLMLQRYDNRAS